MRNKKNLKEPLKLSLDQYTILVKEELENAVKIFSAEGAAAILMDANNGEVLSLVSLPDYNINKRADVKQNTYMNKVTKEFLN